MPTSPDLDKPAPILTIRGLPQCPACRGTGSGLYNVLSWSSVCESCDGTGERQTGIAPAAAVATASLISER